MRDIGSTKVHIYAAGLLATALVAAAAMVFVVRAQAVPAKTVIAEVDRGTEVNAYAGRLVWSSYDESIRAYRLMTYMDGQTSEVPIAPSHNAFDIDLGPGPRSQTLAVYSRCTGKRVWQRRHCRLSSYDFATGVERQLNATHRPGTSEITPTVWRNRLAFARVRPRQSARLYVGALRGVGHIHRLRGGATRCDNTFSWDRTKRTRKVIGAPERLDLDGKWLAFTWSFQMPAFGSGGHRSRDVRGLVSCVGTGASQLLLDRIGGAQRLVRFDTAGGTDGEFNDSPTLYHGNLYYAYGRYSDYGNRIGVGKYRIGSRTKLFDNLTEVQQEYAFIHSFAPGGGRTGYAYAEDDKDGPEIVKFDDLSFTRPSP